MGQVVDYKGYIIVVVKGVGILKEIRAKGRGSIPNKLKGAFTSTAEAQKHIDKYLIEKEG